MMNGNILFIPKIMFNVKIVIWCLWKLLYALKPVKDLKNHGLGKAALWVKKERDLIYGDAFVCGNSVITELLGDKELLFHSVIDKKCLCSAAKLEVSLSKIKG